MRIRIATYNLENLFTRPTAMDRKDEKGRQALEDHATANAIVDQDRYSEADKQVLLDLDKRYRFSALNAPTNALVTLNKIRSQLFRRAQDGTVTVVAEGRPDWTGWFDLRRTKVDWPAVENTGRVIDAVRPDVLVCIEVEDRPTLQRFNDQILEARFACGFPHAMVIDGNDSRGIDVGILSRFPIIGVRPHVDDAVEGQRIFSRDCPEYVIALPSGQDLVVCPNHFKSNAVATTPPPRHDASPKARERRISPSWRLSRLAHLFSSREI